MTSGWHHHGDYDTSIYVMSGALTMEAGPGGGETVVAQSGDFLFVPNGAVYCVSNPSNAASQLIVVRAGSGPPVINVDGPAPS